MEMLKLCYYCVRCCEKSQSEGEGREIMKMDTGERKVECQRTFNSIKVTVTIHTLDWFVIFHKICVCSLFILFMQLQTGLRLKFPLFSLSFF